MSINYDSRWNRIARMFASDEANKVHGRLKFALRQFKLIEMLAYKNIIFNGVIKIFNRLEAKYLSSSHGKWKSLDLECKFAVLLRLKKNSRLVFGKFKLFINQRKRKKNRERERRLSLCIATKSFNHFYDKTSQLRLKLIDVYCAFSCVPSLSRHILRHETLMIHSV